jgi:4-hydroxy-2-oxoheptanedioate aldolase
MGMSFGYQRVPRDPFPTELSDARARVLAACKRAGVAFLDGMTREDVARQIEEGVRISGGGEGGEVAAAGRAYTRRTMPA